MARGFSIPGECMVLVKGNVNSSIASLSQLGLATDSIQVRYRWRTKPVMVNAWGGGEIPVDYQFFLAAVNITMNLIHLDQSVLAECVRLGCAGAPAEGAMPRTGALMGGNAARFAAGNNWIGLNLTAPVNSLPYRFYYARLTDDPFSAPMGTEVQVNSLNWEAIPYTTDPWGGSTAQPNTAAGTGSLGALLWDHVLDS